MSSRRKKILRFLFAASVLAVGFVFFVVLPVLAQAPALNTGLDYAKYSGLVDTDIRVIVARIIRAALGLLGLVALALVIYGGFLYMTAAGNEEQITKAKKILIDAAIGLAIILSSFAIAQFVISKLTDAIINQAMNQETSGGGGGGVGGGGNLFYAVSTPQGNLTIKNVTVSVLFYGNFSFPANYQSSTVPSAAPDNLKVVKKSDSSPAPGDFKLVSASRIDFLPNGSCLDNVNPVNSDPSNTCLEKNTIYQVILTTAIKSTSGLSLECSTIHPCVGEFTTGEKIDKSPPVISLIQPGNEARLQVNTNVDVSAEFKDDAGVKLVSFFQGDVKIKDAPISPPVLNGQIAVSWFSGVSAPATYELKAIAADVDNHETASAGQTVRVLPAHCFDQIKNSDETGVDCGGVCGVCLGQKCQTSLDCAGAYCDPVAKICVARPKITNVDPKDGAIGNYLTIFGKYFGAYKVGASQVVFLGDVNIATDDKVAEIVECSGKNSWQDDFIVVRVLEGTKSGPLQVRTANYVGPADLINQDRTDDDWGPNFPVSSLFAVNNTTRPGLCGITPAKEEPQKKVAIIGSQLEATQGGSQLKFGDSSAVIQLWSFAVIQALVPVLPAQSLTIKAVVNGQSSNSLPFEILPVSAWSGPHIDYIDPSTGPTGAYLTIFGQNFGEDMGKVVFKSGTNQFGELVPKYCGDTWRPDKIIVKVPSEGVNLDYAWVKVITNDGKVSDNYKIYTFDGSKKQANLCLVEPDNGPKNTLVVLRGEGFVPAGMSGMGKVMFSPLDTPASAGTWTDTEIGALVPEAAKSGPAQTVSYGNWPEKEIRSNSLYFKVQNCQTDKNVVCPVGAKCCQGGSCLSSCPEDAGPKSSVYAWSFSTGQMPIVPKVIEECGAGKVPSPTPSALWEMSEQVCVNAVVKTRFNATVKNINDQSFIVEKCADSGCSSASKVAGQLDLALANDGSDNAGGDMVTFTPDANWQLDQWYRVTLTTDIQSDAGDKLSANMSPAAEGKCANPQGKVASYCFKFKTKDSPPELCKLGSAVISPDPFTAKKYDATYYPEADKTLYNVSAIAQDNACWAINASAYDWKWNAGVEAGVNITSDYATITNEKTEGKGNPAQDLITEEKETPTAGEKVWTKTVSSGDSVQDDATLFITPQKPRVVDYWPKCHLACVNAEIGAEFSLPMDLVSLKTALFHECDSGILGKDFFGCNGGTYGLTPKTLNDSNTKFSFDLPPGVSLKKNTSYAVSLPSSVKSVGGSQMEKDFGWDFTTKNDDTLCDVDHTEITPSSATVYAIGDKAPYYSQAFGAADECDKNGQKLISWAYNWMWSSAPDTVASITNWDKSVSGSKIGCNSVCQHTGSQLAPTSGLCGDGKKDAGEDCDAPVKDETTCTLNCLIKEKSNKGTVHCSSTKDYNCCGNDAVEIGEDCDAGIDNGQLASGCSKSCLRIGTPISVAKCKEIGLTLDECLKKGAISVCGNSRVEPGEDCDEGSGNGTMASNCSVSCLFKNKEIIKNSLCGNGVVEPGEADDCDTGGGDAKIDPLQWATAVGKASVDANNQMTAVITALTKNKAGTDKSDTAKFILQCGFSPVDADCPAGGANLGIGKNSCCYPRPKATKIQPAVISNVCPNTAVILKFDQLMDETSFSSSTLGYYNIILSKATSTFIDSCPAGQFKVAEEPLPSANFWQRFKDFARQLFGLPARAQTYYIFCDGAIDYSLESATIVDDGIEKTQVSLIPKEPLTAGNYMVFVIKPWVKSLAGVTLTTTWVFSFKTKTDICQIDYLRIDPETWWLQTAKNEADDTPNTPEFDTKNDVDKIFSAHAYTIQNVGGAKEQELLPFSGVYNWSYNWAVDDSTIVQRGTYQKDIADSAAKILAQSKNGVTQVGATAVIDASSDIDAGSQYSASSTVQVFICENPWPDASFNEGHKEFGLGYVDANGTDDKVLNGTLLEDGRGWTNFKLLYCRDAGKANDQSDDLPELRLPTVLYHKSDANDPIFKEFFLTFETPPAGTIIKEDKNSLGLRVYQNLDHKPLLEWYNAQPDIPKGSPVPIKVGNYDALQEGRTYYIDGLNVSTTLYSIYTNVYVFSFSDNPTAETLNVVNQLLNNLTLNINVPDKKMVEKMYRDLIRVRDFQLISQKLVDYYTDINRGNGSYPKLTENPQLGTFLPSYTNSKWKSWQGVLGNLLGYTLPIDPQNGFYGCGSSTLKTATGVGLGDFDAETCWNATNSTFICPAGSHVYQYATEGGQNAKLMADFETDSVYQWQKPLMSPASNIEFEKYGSCVSVVLGSSGKCGDGVVGPGEDCEIGQIQKQSCSNGSYNGWSYVECQKDCKWGTYSECKIQGKCGDGIIQGMEKCDDGKKNGLYGYCGKDCQIPTLSTPTDKSEGYCGNQKIDEGKEVCDASKIAISFTPNISWCTGDNFHLSCFLLSNLCSKEKSPCVSTGGKYARVKDQSCSWDCQSYDYCGDGRVNGMPRFDNILKIDMPYEECEKSEPCQVGRCSAGLLANKYCEKNEDCPGGICQDYQTGKQYCKVPGEFTVTEENGVYKDSFNQYPLPALSNNTDCHWDIPLGFNRAADSVTCLPFTSPPPVPLPGDCGNGKIDAGEICDAGGSNGDTCTPVNPAPTCTFCAFGCQQVIYVSK